MRLSGFADEAADDIAGQIEVTRALDWQWIEARKVDGVNLHDLPEPDFERVCAALEGSGVGVDCLGSAIANWGSPIEAPFEVTLGQARRAIPRMQRLGARQVRVMSFAVRREQGRVLDDQYEGERFKRLRILCRMFGDAGIAMVHENCANFGGLGWAWTRRLIDHVPGLKLVFDTGNAVGADDHPHPLVPGAPLAKQSSWEFYRQVRDHVVHVHIKDVRWDAATGTATYTWPGEGDGDVRRIVEDLLARGYGGGFSIEPHLAVVHHDPGVSAPQAIRRANYLEYGRRFAALLDAARQAVAARAGGASRG